MAKRDPFFAKLAAAVKGLLLPSESDSPLEVWRLPGGASAVQSAAALAKAAGIPAKTPAEILDAAAFFGPLCTEREGQGPAVKKAIVKFRKLQALMEAGLEGLRIYRFGGTKKTVLIIGVEGEDLVGIKGMQVET
jgi:hypothetical protein